MKPRKFGLVLAMLGLSAFLLTACSDQGTDPASPDPGGEITPASFALEIQPIFDQNCLDCHGAGGNAGLDLRPDFAYDNLVGVAAQASAGDQQRQRFGDHPAPDRGRSRPDAADRRP